MNPLSFPPRRPETPIAAIVAALIVAIALAGVKIGGL